MLRELPPFAALAGVRHGSRRRALHLRRLLWVSRSASVSAGATPVNCRARKAVKGGYSLGFSLSSFVPVSQALGRACPPV
ncbi:ribosomal protein S1 [Parvibacter caecicola]|uniref:Ribosomal protein S1 n=1 Tax=Parvibacter caecicola TaxID=747645 RepID=A0A7W5GPU4_9ACTN|nr:ribosomal protein S1 [Parvibacter caecicola]